MALLPVPARWDGGVREDLPRGAIEPPFCEVADNVEFDSSPGPSKRPGFLRVSKSLPDPAGLRLDGTSSVLIGDPNASGGSNLVLSGDWTVGIGFMLHRFAAGGSDYLWSYANLHDWTDANLVIRTVETTARDHYIQAEIGDGGFARSVTSTATPLKLGVYYHVRVSFNSSTGILSIYLDDHDVAWVDAGLSLPGAQAAPAASRRVLLGALDSDSSSLQSTRQSRFFFLGRIDFHRVRRWNSLKASVGDSTQFDYHMAEMNGFSFADADGNAPPLKLSLGSQDPGTSLPSVPVISHGSNAEWETSSPLIGRGSLLLNGFSQYLQVRDAYLLRRAFVAYETTDESTLWDEARQYGVAIIVKPTDVSTCVLAHMAPVRTGSTDCRVTGGASQEYYFAIGIDSSSKFYFSYCSAAATATTLTSSTTTATADETYLLYAFRSDFDTVIRFKICKLSTGSLAWDEELENAAATADHLDPVTGFRDDDLRSWKYACVLGAEIRATQYAQHLDDPYDPNSFQMSISYDRVFAGYIDSFCFIGTEQEAGAGSGDLPDSVLLQMLDSDLKREDINAMASIYRFLSFYPFNEGEGNLTEDWGLNSNHQYFTAEPEKAHVRNQSSLTVSEEAPPAISGIFERFSPLTTGDERNHIVVAGAAVYELDAANGTLTPIADGLRNDDDVPAVGLPYGRKLLIATGHRPMQLYGDDLFPLGLETFDVTRVRFSFVGQMIDYAEITEGTYRYRFVYFSRWTGEEGDFNGELSVTVRGDNQTQVFFGCQSTDAAYAVLGVPNQRYAKLESDPEPINLTTGLTDPDDFAASRMDVALTADSQAATYRIRINRSDVDDPENVTAKELRDVINEKISLGEVVTKPGGAGDARIIVLRTTSVGTNASVTVNHVAVNAGKGYTNLADILGWTNGQSNTGTAGSASRRPLPVPVRSPQATHIRVYRTLANGGSFYLASEFPIGQNYLGYPGGSYWLDNVADEDLVLRLPMDDRHGEPPDTRDMIEINGRVIYADADTKERIWWSVPDRPHDVEPISYMDLLAGGTLDVTSLERFSGIVLAFKEHATLTLTPTTSPIIPFNPEIREPGVGAVGKHAVVNIVNSLFVGSASFPTTYDSLSYKEIGIPVRETWGSATSSQKENVIATHDIQRRSVLFSIPGLEKILVFNYAKRSWSIWTKIGMRCSGVALEAGNLEEIFFGDQYGVISQLDNGALSDGGNYIEDEMSESLTGTDFSVSSDEVTITAWSATSADDPYLRGAKLRLQDLGGTAESVTVLYVTSGGALKVTPTPSSTGGATSTWAFTAVEGEFTSAEIAEGLNNLHVVRFAGELSDPSDHAAWPTSHDVTLYARINSGVVVPGDIEKTMPVDIPDFVIGLAFQARKFQWGIKNINPNEPFSVISMGFDGEVLSIGRPLT